jgi:ribosomal protein S18 acetylase RimI-like enzyme
MQDVFDLARIHKESYSREHLTSALPMVDLEDYYAFYLENGNHVLLYEEGKILAFVLLVNYSAFNNNLNPLNGWGPRFRIMWRRPFALIKWMYHRILHRSSQKSKVPVRVLSVVTTPEAKGRGLATALLEASEAFLQTKQIDRIGASVRKMNAASNALFKKNGYILEYETHQTFHYYKVIE